MNINLCAKNDVLVKKRDNLVIKDIEESMTSIIRDIETLSRTMAEETANEFCRCQSNLFLATLAPTRAILRPLSSTVDACCGECTLNGIQLTMGWHGKRGRGIHHFT